MSNEAICAAYDAAMLACDTVGTQPLRMAVRDAGDGHVIIDVWWLCAEMVEATVMSRTFEMALSADNEGWHMTRLVWVGEASEIVEAVAEAVAYTWGRHAASLDYRRAYEAVDSPPQGWAAS